MNRSKYRGKKKDFLELLSHLWMISEIGWLTLFHLELELFESNRLKFCVLYEEECSRRFTIVGNKNNRTIQNSEIIVYTIFLRIKLNEWNVNTFGKSRNLKNREHMKYVKTRRK